MKDVLLALLLVVVVVAVAVEARRGFHKRGGYGKERGRGYHGRPCHKIKCGGELSRMLCKNAIIRL